MTTDQGYVAQGGRSELWSLREDVRVSPVSGEGPVRLRSQWGDVTIERPSPVVREALRRLRLGPVSLENVIGPEHGAPETSRARLYAVLDRIQPLVIRTLGFETGQPLLSVVPLTPQARFHPVPLPPDALVRLSTFAQLRTDGREYRLESPLSLHRVQLHRSEALWLIGRLARPTAASGKAWVPLADISAEVLAYLAAAGMLAGTDEPEGTGWSPADLMFHTRSTTGRHDNAFGITYPLGRAGSPEPVVRRAAPGIALHGPRAEGGPDHRLSDRPYPGGGACYELELYVTVGRCTGLARGVYRYDPFGHRLEPVNSDAATVDDLLSSAAERAAMD